MGDALITVWAHREIKGWTGNPAELDDLDPNPTLPLLEAVETTYPDDSHFWPGYIASIETGKPFEAIPRINKTALKGVTDLGGVIRFNVLPLDIDDPVTHKTGAPAREEWLFETLEKIDNTPWVKTAGVYRTRGGMRLIWQLSESLGIEDYLAYSKAFRAELRCAGVDSDELVEFGRCFRLPKVTRIVNGVPTKQDLPQDFSRFGVLDFTPRPGILTESGGKKSGGRFSGIGAVRATKPGYMAPEKITHHRNQELTRFAGKLRQMNMDPEGILAALTHMNDTRCEPPLPEEEIEHIAESSANWTPGNNYNVVTAPPIIEPAPETPEAPSPTPDDPDGPLSDLPFRKGPLGRLVARTKGQILATSAPRFMTDAPAHFAEHALSDIEVNGHPVVFTQGHLWRYDPKRGRWNHLPIPAIAMLLASYDGELILIETEKGASTRPFKVSTGLIDEIYKLISYSRDDPDFFDHQEPGVTFRNGFATVENDQVVLKPFSPHQRAFTSIDMDCDPALTTPTMFVNFLQACFRDDEDGEAKIAVLQEFVGACLLGRATEFQMGLIFIGGGANGKSTMQDVVLAMFDPSMTTSIPPQDMDNEYRRAMLAKSRINIVNELPEADILTSEGVKSLVTGDMITARHIREAPFQYRPRAGHIFSANNLPNVRDLTDGFFRRWTVLSWNRKFEGPDRVLKLAERIIKAELGAVAAWAMAGAVRLQKQGSYTEVPSSKLALQEWREGSDQVALWLSTYAYWPPLEGAPKKKIPTSEMYTNYGQWSAQNGHLKIGSHKFQKRLHALGVERDRNKDGYTFIVQRRTPLAVMNGGLGSGKDPAKA